jgi:hypothetical protein
MHLKKGDYVLATKWNDGDPCDHFFIGFYREKKWGDRYIVEDSNGSLPRAGGFRRCQKISREIGNLLVKAAPIIGDIPGKSIWYWRYHPAQLSEFITTK